MDFGRVLTAMVTPFTNDLQIHWDMVDALVEHLIENNSDGIVVAGTTGESPTLSDTEKLELFDRVVQKANGRAKVIAGTGTNNTDATIRLTKEASRLGVDGIMLVVPYYNRPSQEGLYQHFTMIAQHTDLPIMLYNVPSRTSLNMTADTVIRLSKIENITAVKEASGDLTQMARIIDETNDDFFLYCGDDKLLLPSLSIGAHGIVSVASHVIGKQIANMIKLHLSGDVKMASELHRKLLPVFEGMFFIPSPAPVKAALQLIGLDVGGLRPPLMQANEEEKRCVERLLQSIQLLSN